MTIGHPVGHLVKELVAKIQASDLGNVAALAHVKLVTSVHHHQVVANVRLAQRCLGFMKVYCFMAEKAHISR